MFGKRKRLARELALVNARNEALQKEILFLNEQNEKCKADIKSKGKLIRKLRGQACKCSSKKKDQ